MRMPNKDATSLLLIFIVYFYQFYVPSMSMPIIDNASETDWSSDKNSITPVLSVPGTQINDLTKQILRKEIELDRLNTVFRQKTTLTSCWRQRRMFAYGEGNACMTETGLLLQLPTQYQLASEKMHNGQKAKPRTRPSQRSNIVSGIRMALIANSYGAGGDLIELGLNYINYCRLIKQGFTPGAYRLKVRQLRSEIDKLIEQRCVALSAVSGFSQEDKVTCEQESKLLSDLRDLSLLEYVDYHAGCKRFWLVQNAAYLNDLVKNCVGGAGNIVSLDANHLRRPYMYGASGLLILISGVIILTTPLVGRVTGNISGLTARRIVKQESLDLHNMSIETYREDYQKFLALHKSNRGSTFYVAAAQNRLPLYEDQEKIMLMRKQFLQNEKKQAHGTFVENIIFAGIVGPTKMANGTLIMIAGWQYPHNSYYSRRLFAAATTAYVPGAAFSILETTRLWAVFERNNWKLRNSDMLPSNQLNSRLRMLDNMNSVLGR